AGGDPRGADRHSSSGGESAGAPGTARPDHGERGRVCGNGASSRRGSAATGGVAGNPPRAHESFHVDEYRAIHPATRRSLSLDVASVVLPAASEVALGA